VRVEVLRGGQRRIDRILDPRFVAGVGRLDLAELRSRREEADASLRVARNDRAR
jgi:hypothetical protein